MAVGLTDALARAIERVNERHIDCDRVSPGTPAAAVAIARLEPKVVSYLVLADVTVAAADRQGRVQAVSDERVEAALDPDLRQEALAWPFGSAEQRAAVRAMSLEQLARRNVAGGYWVAAADPRAATEAVTGAFARDRLRDLMVLTDGASALVNSYGAASWSDAFTLVRTGGPGAPIDRVREVEAGDPDGQRWPRFKPSDDAAVAHLPLTHLDEATSPAASRQ